MRIWVYGASPEQIQGIIETEISPADTVVDTSVCAEIDSAFPQSGLTQAISAAIRGKIDVLLVPSLDLLGKGKSAEPVMALFQNYGVSIKSASS